MASHSFTIYAVGPPPSDATISRLHEKAPDVFVSSARVFALEFTREGDDRESIETLARKQIVAAGMTVRHIVDGIDR